MAGEVEWRCARCDGWNPLFAPSCGVCAAPRSGFGDVPAGTERARPAGVLIGASAVWPGVGHLLAGRLGTGLARSLLWGVWLAAAIGLWRAAGAGAGIAARTPALSVTVGAAVLWAGTLIDTQQLAGSGGREVLSARPLGILVAIVTGALLLTAVVVASP